MIKRPSDQRAYSDLKYLTYYHFSEFFSETNFPCMNDLGESLHYELKLSDEILLALWQRITLLHCAHF